MTLCLNLLSQPKLLTHSNNRNRRRVATQVWIIKIANEQKTRKFRCPRYANLDGRMQHWPSQKPDCNFSLETQTESKLSLETPYLNSDQQQRKREQQRTVQEGKTTFLSVRFACSRTAKCEVNNNKNSCIFYHPNAQTLVKIIARKDKGKGW
jgi:hypothetical protein